MRPHAKKYYYTAQECVDLALSHPAFHISISKEKMLADIEDRNCPPYMHGQTIYFVRDINGELAEIGGGREASWEAQIYRNIYEIHKIEHYNPADYLQFARELYGIVCMVCKKLHYTESRTIWDIVGSDVTHFLADKYEFHCGLVYTFLTPLCSDCARDAFYAIFGPIGSRGGIPKTCLLRGKKRPTIEDIELATLEWIALKLEQPKQRKLHEANTNKKLA